MSPLATFVITAPEGKYSNVFLLIRFSVSFVAGQQIDKTSEAVSYTHLRAHETDS